MILERTRAARQVRLFEGGLHTFTIPALVDALLREPEYLRSGRDGVTLVKNDGLRVVLEVLRAGSLLSRHSIPCFLTLEVLGGALRVEAADQVVYLESGDLLVLPAQTAYQIEAVRDVALLLTLGPAAAEPAAPDDRWKWLSVGERSLPESAVLQPGVTTDSPPSGRP